VEFADGSQLPADLILMSVGVKAEVELARAAGLEIGETGGVKTNGRLESSDPNIYAVGDAAETMHALTAHGLALRWQARPTAKDALLAPMQPVPD